MKEGTPLKVMPRPADSTEDPGEAGLNLRGLIAILLGAKWRIACLTLVVGLLSVLYAFFATPIYEADALIQIEEPDNTLFDGTTSINNALGGLLTSNAPAEAEIKIMTSRSVLMPVVRRLHLDIIVKRDCLPVMGCLLARDGPVRHITVTDFQARDLERPFILKAGVDKNYILYSPDHHPVLAGMAGEPAVSADGRTKLYVQALSAPAGTSFVLSKTPAQIAAARLRRRLAIVQLGKNTGIVRLTLKGPRPARIQQVVNAVADQYLKQNIAAKSARARESLAFISTQLPDLKAKLTAAETSLSDYRVKHGTVNIDLQTKSLLQHNLDLRSELSKLELQEVGIAQKFNPKFPTYAALRQKETSVRQQLSELERKINHLPEQQQQYIRLKRDVNVYDALYTTMLSKAQDLRVAQAGTMGNVRVVDHAVTPVAPVKPQKGMIIALGFLFGMVLSILMVFLKRVLSASISEPDSLETAFGIPLYAMIPHSKTLAAIGRNKRSHKNNGTAIDMTPFAREWKDSSAVEAIRSLGISVYFATRGLDRPVVTIGSASPGSGKSFVSANLARLIAQSGQSVLLVDADLRKGHLNDYFRTGRSPGLAEILSGRAQPDEAVKTSPESRFNFISSGSLPSNPSELLLTPLFERFIDESSQKYDVVLLDVPPYLAVGDGFIIARYSRLNFLLVRDGENTPREITHVVRRLHQNNIQLTGFIYNGFDRYGFNYAHGNYGLR